MGLLRGREDHSVLMALVLLLAAMQVCISPDIRTGALCARLARPHHRGTLLCAGLLQQIAPLTQLLLLL